MAQIIQRPRRNRRTESLRRLLSETRLSPSDLVLPMFLQEGKANKTAINSMPGVFRLSQDLLIAEAKAAFDLGVPAIALFPVVPENLKDPRATESKNKSGLLHQAIKSLKDTCPELVVITDVAMDPYSSDGHDGFVENGKINNDVTLDILAAQALSQAEVGADIIAPSDMMDGRVGFIRRALDESGYIDTGILSYAAKYASSFYGPFREALDSAPKSGDKKTYQMNPANSLEALREALLDIEEGADILMVKPALAYLDIITKIKEKVHVPVAAYQVSGEYAMILAASERGWLNADLVMMESLMAIKRAGSDLIFTYAAKKIAESLN